MKKLLIIFLILFSADAIILFSADARAKNFAKAQIFACEPEWGSLAQEIVGDKANVVIATNQFQNPHFIQAKPSLIADIRQSDIVFCSGADLEVGWLPELLDKASKPEIQVGQSGYLMASDYVRKLEVPKNNLDRAEGDIHPFGNPHVHLNPHNIPPIAEEFLKRIIAVDPANAEIYQKNYDNFIKRWNLAMVKWDLKAQKLKGMPIVVSHNAWAYLVDWLGLKVVATIEPKPGIAPNIKDLFAVLKKVQSNQPEMIIYALYENKDPIFWLSEKSGTKAIMLPFTIYGVPKTPDLFSIFDNTLKILTFKSGVLDDKSN